MVTFGKVKEGVLTSFGIKKEVYYAEFDMDVLLTLSKNKIRFSALPKFPGVRRDIAVVINPEISFGQIEELAQKTSGNLLKEIRLFDVYEDEKLGNGKKSYAISFLFLDEDKTLTDAEVNSLVDKMIRQFESKLNASIRN